MKISKFIAHRGAHKVAPENTMLAFEIAYKAGARWMQLTVQLSADNMLFIFHDNNAANLAGVDEDLTTFLWEEIKSLEILSDRFPNAHAVIPSMKEYLTWMSGKPDLHTNIEILVRESLNQSYETRMVNSLLMLLKDYPKLHQQLLLSSFSEYVLERLVLNNILVPRQLLIEVNNWEKEESIIFTKIKENFNALGCVALGINSTTLTKPRIEQLKKVFTIIFVYSIEILTDKEIHKLLEEGVDSVFIDSMKVLQTAIKRIGFLATGDEIATGDVINTNTPKIAEKLYEKGFQLGIHLTCFDDKKSLKASLNFLLSEHDIIITVGGLGPTEDDKTCEAIAKVCNQPLIFNEESWQRICARVLSRFTTVPENNKKQAYFPQGAQILVNINGTSDGCYIQTAEGKHLFMLPGPPHECLPMFDQAILPRLMEMKVNNKPTFYQWQLLGASEAHVACMLSSLANEYQIQLGYRAAYPYLEVKLHVLSSKNVELLAEAITNLVEPFLATITKEHASDVLKAYLRSGEVSITMQKDITKGYVYSHLEQLMPKAKIKVKLSLQLKTNGMVDFWGKSEKVVDDFFLLIKAHNHIRNEISEHQLHVCFSNNGKHTFQFIYEWICSQIIRVIQKEAI